MQKSFSSTTIVDGSSSFSNKTQNKKDSFLGETAFKQVVKDAFKGSAIHPDLFDPSNFQRETSYEHGDHELTGLMSRLGWKDLSQEEKSRWSPEKIVYWFCNEDGTDFQCIFNSADTDNEGNIKRRYRYYAPKNIGDILYFPAIPFSIRKLISERFNIPVGGYDRNGIPNIPSDLGDFWAWYCLYGWRKLPLVITEGAKKCLSLLSKGVVAIALFGCSCGVARGETPQDIDDIPGIDKAGFIQDETKSDTKKKGKKPVLELKQVLKRFVPEGSTVILALDNDNKAKKSTRVKTEYSKNRLMKALLNNGCHAVKMEWSADFKGVDDLIIGDLKHFEERLEIALSGLIPDELQQMYTKLLTHFGGAIRFNELKNHVEVDGESFTGETTKKWWSDLFNEKKSKEDIMEVLISYARNHSFDPFTEYLLGLKQVQGLPQVDLNKLSTTLLNTNNDLYDIYFKKFLIGAVARSLKPGCKNDLVLVLQGEQGLGKSTFFSDLAKKPEWFDDGLSASKVSEKDEVMRLHYSKILELAELEALFKRKDISQLRADVSRREDKVRLPYASKVIELPRRSVFCGTVNPRFFLMDPEGNRRFMVIPVTKIERLNDSMVDAIWLQALLSYESGETWWLNEGEQKLQELNNKEFEERDEWYDSVQKYCSGVELSNRNSDSTVYITVTGFLTSELKIYPSQIKNGDKIRVSNILKQLGYVQIQLRSGPDRGKRVFVKPVETSPQVETTTPPPQLETSSPQVVATTPPPQLETSSPQVVATTPLQLVETTPPQVVTTSPPQVETTPPQVVTTSPPQVETTPPQVVTTSPPPECDRSILDIYGKIPEEISKVTIEYSAGCFKLLHFDRVIVVTNTIENMLKHFHDYKCLNVTTVYGDYKDYFDEMWICLAYENICKWFNGKVKY